MNGTLKKILIGLFAIPVLFMLLETALRLFDVRYEKTEDNLSQQVKSANAGSEAQVRLLPGSGLFWEPIQGRLLDGKYIIQQDGFRGFSPEDRLPTEGPKQGTKRVLCLGDSVTFGLGIGRTEDTWPAQLAAALGPGYEVLNLGRVGYTSFQGKTLMKMYAQQLWPDVAVVAFGWADKDPSPKPDSARVSDFRLEDPGLGIKKTLLGVRTIQIIANALNYEPVEHRRRVPSAEFPANLIEIAKSAPKTIFLILPEAPCGTNKFCKEDSQTDRHEEYNLEIRKMEMYGRVLDIRKSFLECGPNCYYKGFPVEPGDGEVKRGDTINPNEFGAKLTAQYVAREIAALK